MTTATATPPAAARPPRRPRASSAPPATSTTSTAQGPWPGVTSITRVLDAPALTNWKLGEVARSAVENAERLIEDREAGKVDAAVKYLTTLSTSAMDRGSRIHGNIESILRREPFTPDPRDADAVAGARAWLNQQATRARPAAARGRGVPDQRDPRLRRHARPDRRARRRDLAARLEDREVGRLAGRPGVRRPPAPAGGLRQRRVHRPDRRPGAAPAAGGHPVRHRPRHRRRHAAVRGRRHRARLDRLPRLPEPVGLAEERRQGGVSVDRQRLAGCALVAFAVLGFWTLVVGVTWCLCRVVWP